jgi:IS5 family transposase
MRAWRKGKGGVMLRKEEPDFTFVDAAFIHKAKKWKDHWLKKILDKVNWKPFEKIFRELYSCDEGRPAWEPVKLFRCLLLAEWYGMSDRTLEEAMTFRIDFIKFSGLPIDEAAPDATTFVVFRRRIQRHWDKMMRILKKQLEEAGYSINKAVAVDATLVEAHSRPQKQYGTGEVNGGDAEAAWRGYPAKKKKDDDGNEVQTRKPPLFGYKINMTTSVGTGFISGFTVCPANEHESKHFEELIKKDMEAVYGDKGYSGNRKYLKRMGIGDKLQAKGARGRTLTKRDITRNKSITKKRRIIEGVFGSLKQWYGWHKTRFLGLARNQLAVSLSAIAWNMKKWVRYV